MLGCDLLSFIRVEVLQVLFRHLAGASLVSYFIYHSYGRLGKDALGRSHHFELVRPQFVYGQEGLILPGQEHVTKPTLYEGVSGTAGSGIKYRHILEEFGNEIFGLGIVTARLMQGKCPGSQVIPAGAAGGFGIWSNHRHTRLDEVIPVLDFLWISLAHQKDDSGGIR